METQLTTTKKYLGDGVYLRSDGYHIILSTENGLEVTNEIFLDPVIWDKLLSALVDKDDIPR